MVGSLTGITATSNNGGLTSIFFRNTIPASLIAITLTAFWISSGMWDRHAQSLEPCRLAVILKPDLECQANEHVKMALRLFVGGGEQEIQAIGKKLMEDSTISRQCRQQVVGSLIKAMDRPNLDFRHDHELYLIWRYGGPLLGELHAVEAVDLFIEHIGERDGLFDATMIHQPALESLISMGHLAVPQLAEFLSRDRSPFTQSAAIYCLTYIGGSLAVCALRGAISICATREVKRLIGESLKALDNKSQEFMQDVSWLGKFMDAANSDARSIECTSKIK